jgi:polysaccharide export outer membrane protein
MPVIHSWKITLLFLSAFMLFSCASRKKMVYFNAPGEIPAGVGARNYEPMFRADDLLAISVAGSDPLAVKPFNLEGSSLDSRENTQAAKSPAGPVYLVDANGMIDFPVLGPLKIGGLDRTAALKLISEKLQPYVSGAVVNIRILNYKITVLGEVKNPGTFTIPNERITLPEALGLAGDLLITGLRKNVLVIRDTDGKKTETRVDLTSKELFASPVYYLQQNDLVYVEPNKAKINSSVVNTASISLVASVVSIIVALSVLLTR